MIRSPRKFLNHTGGLAFIEFALVFPFLFVLLFGCVEVVRMIYIQQKVEKAGHVISDVVARYMPATNTPTAGQISVDEINNNVFPIFGRIMGAPSTGGSGGFGQAANQAVIVTSISRIGGNDIINWQIASPGTNQDNQMDACDGLTPNNCTISVVNGRRVGQVSPSVRFQPADFRGDTATQTGGSVLQVMTNSSLLEGENMVISEVFFRYKPLLTLFLEDTNLASATHISVILKPRIYTKRTFFIPRNGALRALPPVFPLIVP
jgi:hypothetical protein